MYSIIQWSELMSILKCHEMYTVLYHLTLFIVVMSRDCVHVCVVHVKIGIGSLSSLARWCPDCGISTAASHYNSIVYRVVGIPSLCRAD